MKQPDGPTMTETELAEWVAVMLAGGQRAYSIANGGGVDAYTWKLTQPAKQRDPFSPTDLRKRHFVSAVSGLAHDEAVDALMRVKR